jgi:uncharacterized protein YjcR
MTERNYDDECGDHGGDGGDCGLAAGWGTDFDSGKCKFHRGTNADGSSHDGNTNAVNHGAYADHSSLYSDEFSEQEQGLADSIFQDYLELYQHKHGVEPPVGHKLRLFKIAVNSVTELRVENWYSDKPDDLDTETPYINRETHVSESGERYYRYKKAPSVAAIKHLEGYNRKWLEKLGLLPDDSADVEVNVVAELWDDLTGYYEEQQ